MQTAAYFYAGPCPGRRLPRPPASSASLGVLNVPVVGIVSSVILLGEEPTIADIAGFALIFATSACVLLWPYEPKPQETRTA
jgi:drug/metabolite transporter (DMT)-like permease